MGTSGNIQIPLDSAYGGSAAVAQSCIRWLITNFVRRLWTYDKVHENKYI